MKLKWSIIMVAVWLSGCEFSKGVADITRNVGSLDNVFHTALK